MTKHWVGDKTEAIHKIPLWSPAQPRPLPRTALRMLGLVLWQAALLAFGGWIVWMAAPTIPPYTFAPSYIHATFLFTAATGLVAIWKWMP